MIVTAGFFQCLYRGFGGALLGVVVIENRRPVLFAPVHILAFHVGRVGRTPQSLEQAFVGDRVRVVVHLDRLGMACAATSYLFIVRVLLVAATITRHRLNNAGYFLFIRRFHAPETATSERSNRQAWVIRGVL